MPRTRRARASLWLKKLPRWKAPAGVALLSFSLHASTLRGTFVWDDRPAVLDNHDVWSDSPWSDMWRHDFWGQKMADAESHKSFRPLTTFTYRLSNMLAQALSAERSVSDGSTEENVDLIAAGLFRGAGPKHSDAPGFHLFNVIVHAATCASSTWLFRCVFAGDELPAVAASLLFTVHPVHVEAVAPIVGRADLLCGFFAVIALSLTVGGGSPVTVSNKPNGCARGVKPDAGSRDQQSKGGKRSKRRKRNKQSGIARSRNKSPAKLGVVHDSIHQDISAARKHVTAPPVKVASAAVKSITKADNVLPTGSEKTPTAAVCSEYGTRVANDSDQSRPSTAADTPSGAHCARLFNTKGTSQTSTAGGNGKESPAAANTPGALSEALEPVSEVAPSVASMPDASSASAAEPNASNTPRSTVALGALPGPKEVGAAVAGAAASVVVAVTTAAAMSCIPRNVLLATKKVGLAGKGVASDSGPGALRFIAALGFACAATLCKEIGVTVFGLMAGADVVRFLDESNCWQSREKSTAGDDASVSTGLREALRKRFSRFRPAPSAARITSAVLCALGFVLMHLSLHEGVGVREWGVLENDISILPSRKERAMSYAYTHALYASKLLWPNQLCYDWGFRCIPHVTSFADPANLAPLTLYAAIVGGALISIVRSDTAMMWGLALMVVPFVPASNALFPIGAVVAERLLYLPSLGACVLAACMLRRYSSLDSATSRVPANKTHGSLGSSTANTEYAGTDGCRLKSFVNNVSPPDKPGQQQHTIFPGAVSSPLAKAPASGNSSELLRSQTPEGSGDDDRHRFQSASVLSTPSPPAKRGSHKGGNTPPHGSAGGATTNARKRSPSVDVPDIASLRREVGWASHGSRDGERKNKARLSGLAEATRGLLVGTAARGNGAGFVKSQPFERARRKRPSTSSHGSGASKPRVCGGDCPGGMHTASRVGKSLRSTVSMGLLAAWTAFFGARTLRRCEDWNSERALFESALRVCPDGIKTLNNLASGMLNVDEAPRAEGLLRRAIELHPDFPSALFNFGVSVMLTGDHFRAVLAMERALELEPKNSKTVVYLGQEYLALTREALQADREGMVMGQGVMKRISHNGVLADASPESLLWRAEFYTDQALAAGSGFPLARLVKGQALVLRGQFQEAAEHFQEGIDASLRLLSDSTPTGSGEGGIGQADALDLPAAYNSLGLALREAGRRDNAEKEAFLSGLLVAPEDLALLVNGGAAHQAAGDIPGARALYHRALAVHPTSPELLSNLGWLEEQSGGGSLASLEAAAELYVKALRVLSVESPARRQVEVNLANVRSRLGALLKAAEGID